MTSVSNLAMEEEEEEAVAPRQRTVLEEADALLADTAAFPDAPSRIPMYLRALLILAVERERRETKVA